MPVEKSVGSSQAKGRSKKPSSKRWSETGYSELEQPYGLTPLEVDLLAKVAYLPSPVKYWTHTKWIPLVALPVVAAYWPWVVDSAKRSLRSALCLAMEQSFIHGACGLFVPSTPCPPGDHMSNIFPGGTSK